MLIKGISAYVIKRIPRYYRFLGDLSAAGIKRISSGELAKRMGLTASQIRQDLNCFGGFGQQGYGYNTDILREEIGNILGISKERARQIERQAMDKLQKMGASLGLEEFLNE